MEKQSARKTSWSLANLKYWEQETLKKDKRKYREAPWHPPRVELCGGRESSSEQGLSRCVTWGRTILWAMEAPLTKQLVLHPAEPQTDCQKPSRNSDWFWLAPENFPKGSWYTNWYTEEPVLDNTEAKSSELHKQQIQRHLYNSLHSVIEG